MGINFYIFKTATFCYCFHHKIDSFYHRFFTVCSQDISTYCVCVCTCAYLIFIYNLYFCFRRVKSYIAKAKSSVYVCAYLLCIDEIAEELVNSHIRRCKVKIICDHNMDAVISASKINFLQKRGENIQC